MSIETPTQPELEARMAMQKKVASEMLGFDVGKNEEMTPDNEIKFLTWINENGLYFKNLLEKSPEIWERVTKGEVQKSDLDWIIAQFRDDYDLGAEDHEDSGRSDV